MTLVNCVCHPRRGAARTLVADAVSKRDPTGTGGTRRKYEAEMVRRFRAVKRLMRQALVELDVLGLKPTTPQGVLNAMLFGNTFGKRDAAVADAVAPRSRAFAFGTRAEKVSSFMDWLYQAERDGILGVQQGTPLRSASRTSWQNTYIDTAYQKGIRDAGAKLGRTVAGFNQPVHAERVGLIYTRSYRDLENITDAMDAQISRALAEGIAEGRGVRDIARDLDDRVESIGVARARTLARTEVIRAHAEATLTSYEEAGVLGVEVEAEFTTSDDDSVCEECADLQGTTMEISEARGLIPVHPNCRCAFLPVVGEPRE